MNNLLRASRAGVGRALVRADRMFHAHRSALDLVTICYGAKSQPVLQADAQRTILVRPEKTRKRWYLKSRSRDVFATGEGFMRFLARTFCLLAGTAFLAGPALSQSWALTKIKYPNIPKQVDWEPSEGYAVPEPIVLKVIYLAK